MFGVDLAPVEIALGQHVQSFDPHEFQDDALAVGVAIGLLKGLGELDQRAPSQRSSRRLER